MFGIKATLVRYCHGNKQQNLYVNKVEKHVRHIKTSLFFDIRIALIPNALCKYIFRTQNYKIIASIQKKLGVKSYQTS